MTIVNEYSKANVQTIRCAELQVGDVLQTNPKSTITEVERTESRIKITTSANRQLLLHPNSRIGVERR